MLGNCALILAAGKGKRMGVGFNKQFLDINNKPILYYTLKAFDQHEEINSIILVAAEEEIDYCKNEIINKYGIKKVKKVVCGGEERQHSVLNGLKEVDDANIVLIHDGARPFISKKIISDGIKYANMHGAAACGVTPKDTIKIIDDKGFSCENLDRDTLISIQTPQCFQYDLILKCHNDILDKNIKITDDTSVVEYFGYRVYIYKGEYSNIKITTPEDLIIGKNLSQMLNC
ncbi:2-C-methyl-D-erythritol 4-phosphate cytidylyltransferase [Clostridium sp. MSJ-11]|uniref:2-C-methyl-D-erythritol 4-phosphate cytidylyltransferase n=1 Tax=Clostridium mobile TaxID=2841512 RepID=A0ABS6EIN7_9CLOT|nr:2-C-methyl-D-erythritol 4-phosphate cytidylyltransferase [Clostridium mobile]MBU5485007.1 2-C-methyl-D-erythritol 4-phosphate cytidylyltransferase [Clostridium mobile]